MISIMLVDEHRIVRAGIKHMINSQPDMGVLWEADNGEDAVRLAIEHRPDIVIMDINIPIKNGLVATKQITEEDKKIKVIILTMYDDKEYILHVLQAGASSYLQKSHHENDLMEAIRAVYQGGAYLYPKATKLILDEYMKKSINGNTDLQKLTGREQEILAYVAKGYTNREIAEQLYLSIKTIESHRAKVMEKLPFRNRPELVKYALRNGLLDFT